MGQIREREREREWPKMTKKNQNSCLKCVKVGKSKYASRKNALSLRTFWS